ncbi:uncharacterized protein LOC143775097 [Ranitomeya variabilis]|uniref:uncharacterized protein LOC143775097 n=1 Tax=Ranitomeya variabilis TaxID=490064 RepID=UPI004056A969
MRGRRLGTETGDVCAHAQILLLATVRFSEAVICSLRWYTSTVDSASERETAEHRKEREREQSIGKGEQSSEERESRAVERHSRAAVTPQQPSESTMKAKQSGASAGRQIKLKKTPKERPTEMPPLRRSPRLAGMPRPSYVYDHLYPELKYIRRDVQYTRKTGIRSESEKSAQPRIGMYCKLPFHVS